MIHDDSLKISKDKKSLYFTLLYLLHGYASRAKCKKGQDFGTDVPVVLFFFRLKGEYTQKVTPTQRKINKS